MTSARMARTALLTSALLAGACAEANEPARPTLLPELAAMEPVIACMDTAPRETTAALEACAAPAGILRHDTPSEPKTAADFKDVVAMALLVLDRSPERDITPETFASALDFAACVEAAAYADERFSSRTEAGVNEARWFAEEACKTHPLSPRALDPETAHESPDALQRLFARALANAAISYALEANGWFPDEMRPCIRYLDGRPPSIGCTLNPQPRVAPRPPPPAPR
jgi:hypothetical protein